MKFNRTAKSLCIAGMASLTLFASVSQADPGDYPNYNNPWLSGPASQPMNRVEPVLYPPASQPMNRVEPVPYPPAFKQALAQFESRFDNQLQDILNGMEQGRLTLHESVGLLREHVAINVLERRYLSDGRLGPDELRDLDQRLDQARRHIMMNIHDREQPSFNYYRRYR